MPSLPPAEATIRFNTLFISMLEALSQKDHPLVLMLDDVQWAGPASLRLLRVVLSSPRLSHVMLILSFRSNEVPPGHPADVVIQETASQAAWTRTSIHLEMLGREPIKDLVLYQLGHHQPDGLDALVAELERRTGGNPFLVLQVRRCGVYVCEREGECVCVSVCRCA